ncbi:MAG: hypothetical protein IJ197_04495 [Bacteroidaceae bacterium]|nr:hypothetical protein [Bacteroidaceae bacterium]
MKNLFTIIIFLLFPIFLWAEGESESAKPTFGVTVEREIAFAIVEEIPCSDVIVELKSSQFTALSTWVKVTIRDAHTGKKLYKKRFNGSYLYGFSSGDIVVGKGNILTQVAIYKFKDTGRWGLQIKEKGIY